MDLFMLVYGLFLFATGYLSGLVFTWLWFKTQTPKRHMPYWYSVHDEVDMILDALES